MVKRENYRSRVYTLAIILIFSIAWLTYITVIDKAWTPSLPIVLSCISNLKLSIPVPSFGNFYLVLVGLAIIFLLSLTINLIIFRLTEPVPLAVLTIALTLGISGYTSIILGILGILNKQTIILSLFTLCIITLSIIFHYGYRKFLADLKTLLKNRPTITPGKIMILTPYFIIYFWIFYHAIFTPIIHWDALMYHASLAKIFFIENKIPLIYGTSIGIQTSANYPPLFPSIAALLYVLSGGVNEIYLKMVSPTASLVTLLSTYLLSKIIYRKHSPAYIATMILVTTPLFIRYSFYTVSYMTSLSFIMTSLYISLKALHDEKLALRRFVLSGVLFGFGLLSVYHAIYLIPIATVIWYYIINQLEPSKKRLNIVLLTLLMSVSIGGTWYLRNFMLLNNPLYPMAYNLFDGRGLDDNLLAMNFDFNKWNGNICSLGGKASLIDSIIISLTFHNFFPSLFIVTIFVSLVYIILTLNRRLLILCAIPFLYSFIVTFLLCRLIFCFPRYFLFVLPFSAMTSVALLNELKSDNHKLIAIPLTCILLISPGFSASFLGKVNVFCIYDQPPANACYVFESIDKFDNLTRIDFWYPEVHLWIWLNNHLKENEKVAPLKTEFTTYWEAIIPICSCWTGSNQNHCMKNHMITLEKLWNFYV